MNCFQVDELLEEFSLGALSLEEEGTIRSHITDCRKHDQALTALQDVVERLLLAAPEQDPPAALRASLLARFEDEVASRDEAPPVRSDKPVFLRPEFWPVAVAALLLVAIGLGAWSLAISIGGDGGEIRSVFSGSVGGGALLYIEDEQLAVLDIMLPAPDGDHVYQAWGMFEGQATSLGLVPHEGVSAFRNDLSEASAVAISVEPLGGSDQPTTEPVLVARLD